MNTLLPKTSRFSSLYCAGEILDQGNDDTSIWDVVVRGVIHDTVPSGTIRYMAASPADRRASYSGSGLPFHSAKQAMIDTPSKGTLKLRANTFEVPLLFPNSYYINLGNQLIPPTLFLSYENASGDNKVINIKLSDPIPYRLLGYPCDFTQARSGADFYHAHHNLPVRSQEQVLRDSAYPDKNKMSADFWGLKPAL